MGEASNEIRSEDTRDAVLAFIHAQTWVASRSMLRAKQQILLAPAADELLAKILEQNQDPPEIVELLARRRQLLTDAKRVGVEAAYDELITPRYVASLEQEMQTLPYGDRRHLDVIQALLERVDPSNSEERIFLQIKLGTSLAHSDQAAGHSRGIELVEGAVSELRAEQDRARLASALNVLGQIHLRHNDDPASMQAAIACFREALENVTLEENSRLWGILQLGLADALVQVAGRAELAGDAIEHYQAALQFWSGEDPEMSRSLQERIARLLRARANNATDLRTRLNDLLRASALMSREDAPEDWARMQHNVGESYRLLAAEGDAAAGERAIEHLGQALEVFNASDYPVDFGLAANSLGAAYLHRIEGDRSDNVERALTHLHAALAARPRDQYPDFWAKTQVNLGGAYMMRLSGKAEDNIEAAIRHLSAALQGSVGGWSEAVRGSIESQLGRAYCLMGSALYEKQSRGAEETERAIEYFERGLSLPAAVEQSLMRAQAEQNLASLYEHRSDGEKTANLIKALTYYESAREHYDRAGFAAGSATCQYWIGCVLRKRLDLPAFERLTAAIEHLQAALERYPQDAPASVRIDMQMEIGDALFDLAAGDRGESIETAIVHYQAALAQLDSTDARRAQVHSSLGVAFLEGRGGDRAANLERAIDHQRQVLASVTREQDARSWARAHHNLGNVYGERTLGDRAQNLEDAIENFNAALAVFTREAAPEDWAMTQNSLGGAYTFRVRGDRSENFEAAIGCYSKALEVYTQAAHPADWAMTLHNLGNAYLQRIEGYEPENIERAINALEKSLLYRTREALPFFWAMTHANLGTAHTQRKYGDQAANLREAARHYRLALEVYTKETSPSSWAGVQFQLGSLSSSEELGAEERIAYLTAALEEYRQDTHPERWALAHNNLALIYRERSRTDPAARQNAIEHLQLALRALPPEQLPQHYRTVHINLADEYLAASDWQAALDAYRHAIDVGETLLAAAYSEQGRLEESSATSRLYTHAAYCLLQLGDIEQSVVQLDAGRTRLLAESLARSHADLHRLPPLLGERLERARRKLDELEAAMRMRDDDLPVADKVDLNQLQQLFPNAPRRQEPGFTVTSLTWSQARVALGAHGLHLSFSDQAREARQALDAIVREARALDPDFMHAGIDAGDIIDLVPAYGALVTFMLTPAGSAAVVIPHHAKRVDSTHVLTLSNDAYDRAHALLQGTSDVGGWFHAYLESREERDLTGWRETIEATTQALWQIAMGPLRDRLETLGLAPGAPVILMPQSTLALLPLHAAWREVDGRPRSFLDDYTVSYAPSLYALRTGQQQLREPARMHKHLLAVVDPTEDLPYAAVEGAAVASHFTPATTSALWRTEAAETTVVAAVSGANYLHFATHGEYDWRDVMRSHLLLAQGSRLTLARVMSTDFDLNAARLVVLSACETGLAEFQRAPDEFLGLPAGFIEGGAPGVVSALWAINDLSTALLFQEFYRRHLAAGQDVASALRGAQLWLRDSTAQDLKLAEHWERIYKDSDPPDGAAYRMMRYCRANPGATPYAAPYYWAAFTFNGT